METKIDLYCCLLPQCAVYRSGNRGWLNVLSASFKTLGVAVWLQKFFQRLRVYAVQDLLLKLRFVVMD